MRKAAERKLAQSDDGPADAYSRSKIIVIRCGGKQGAIIRELLDRPDDAIWVWDDGEAVHHSLRRLRRLKGAVPEDVSIVECYVATGSSDLRRRLVSEIEERTDARWTFPTLIHPTAFVSPSATIAHGCFLGPLAVVHSHAQVGKFCLINSAALVEHDCIVSEFCTLNPGSIILGSVQIDCAVTVGANATVRENRRIRERSVIGMGAAVVTNVDRPAKSGEFWGGVPAAPKQPKTLRRVWFVIFVLLGIIFWLINKSWGE